MCDSQYLTRTGSERVRQYLDAHQMSLQDFAAVSGLSYETVCKIMAGACRISWKSRLALCNAIGKNWCGLNWSGVPLSEAAAVENYDPSEPWDREPASLADYVPAPPRMRVAGKDCLCPALCRHGLLYRLARGTWRMVADFCRWLAGYRRKGGLK